jgi:hypothetical protein
VRVEAAEIHPAVNLGRHEPAENDPGAPLRFHVLADPQAEIRKVDEDLDQEPVAPVAIAFTDPLVLEFVSIIKPDRFIIHPLLGQSGTTRRSPGGRV